MDDLIKRSDVLKLIHNAGGCDATDEYSRGWDELANHLYSEVESLPTAYNPDKVVEQLEETRNKAIDEFAEKITSSQEAHIWSCSDTRSELCDCDCEDCLNLFKEEILGIAEKLKEGGTDG